MQSRVHPDTPKCMVGMSHDGELNLDVSCQAVVSLPVVLWVLLARPIALQTTRAEEDTEGQSGLEAPGTGVDIWINRSCIRRGCSSGASR